MQTASVKEIRDELKQRSPKELLEICLRMSRFKKDNKELLTYLLFEADDEVKYIEGIKKGMEEEFSQINTTSYYYIRKSVRKILNQAKKQIRYSQKKETEVEILLCFCSLLKSLQPGFNRSIRLQNVYQRQLERIKKVVSGLHEDLQYDYQLEIEAL